MEPVLLQVYLLFPTLLEMDLKQVLILMVTVHSNIKVSEAKKLIILQWQQKLLSVLYSGRGGKKLGDAFGKYMNAGNLWNKAAAGGISGSISNAAQKIVDLSQK